MKKILLVFVLCFSFTLFKIGDVQASETTNAVYYDLNKGGTQEFVSSDSEGHTVHIVVEEVPGISLFSVNNGNYKISGKKLGQWEASYYVTVSGSRFTRAYSPSAAATIGSFTRTALSLVSDRVASYELAWKAGALASTSFLNATLGSSAISITY